ncbi:MAG TPA: O-methyltransferase [Burkholderiales bacterium]|nr:O-methyltransferase [Burkholderiales bacterium]
MELWDKVDQYIADTLVQPDKALTAALEASDKAGLPAISVSPSHGKLLWILARLVNAKRILEVGTLGGYSAIWMARALPEAGKLISLEAVAKHAEVARKNIERAGLGARVEVRIGQALDTLPSVQGPFDFAFIDADKQNNAEYFSWALKLSRPGSVIVVDNVVRDGKVVDARSRDASVQGVRRLNELIAAEKRVSATAIQTVGMKGYDGFAVALVTG